MCQVYEGTGQVISFNPAKEDTSNFVGYEGFERFSGRFEPRGRFWRVTGYDEGSTSFLRLVTSLHSLLSCVKLSWLMTGMLVSLLAVTLNNEFPRLTRRTKCSLLPYTSIAFEGWTVRNRAFILYYGWVIYRKWQVWKGYVLRNMGWVKIRSKSFRLTCSTVLLNYHPLSASR